jgi:phenylacetate-coenzyme A ligase PaaK-like adenylate-forming protein
LWAIRRATSNLVRSGGALDARLGCRPGDIVHNAYGYGLFTGGLGAHYGAERLGARWFLWAAGMTERQVSLITDFKPRVHHGDAILHALDPR